MEKAVIQNRMKPVGSGARIASEAVTGAAWPPHLPPWGTPSTWQAVTTAVDHHLSLPHILAYQPLQRNAAAIVRLMARMDAVMETLVQKTCLHCIDTCCQRATVWYDDNDLLVLGFTGQPWPSSQPMSSVGDRCCYLGPAGCRLPRIQRPWICTWYLCPRQTDCLQASMRSASVQIARWLRGMKCLRNKLLHGYMDATVPKASLHVRH